MLQTHAVGARWEGTEQPSALANQHRGFLPPKWHLFFHFPDKPYGVRGLMALSLREMQTSFSKTNDRAAENSFKGLFMYLFIFHCLYQSLQSWRSCSGISFPPLSVTSNSILALVGVCGQV